MFYDDIHVIYVCVGNVEIDRFVGGIFKKSQWVNNKWRWWSLCNVDPCLAYWEQLLYFNRQNNKIIINNLNKLYFIQLC